MHSGAGSDPSGRWAQRLQALLTRGGREASWSAIPWPLALALPAGLVLAGLLMPPLRMASPDMQGDASAPAAPPASLPAAPLLPSPPALPVLRALALGEPAALSRAISIGLLMHESNQGEPLPLQRLDYPALLGWMDRALALDPSRHDLVLLVARVYAEVPEPTRQRLAIAFVARHFAAAPAERWPALAHVTVLARHRLGDLALARELARTLRVNSTAAQVPRWAREMELTVLEAQGEREAARELIGALLVEGGPREGAELRFLQRYLAALDRPAAAAASAVSGPAVSPPVPRPATPSSPPASGTRP